MAAILQFRQGSKTSFISSGPYISEPFFDTDTNIIHIGVSGSSSITLTKLEDINSGSFSVSGDITASNIVADGFISNDGGNVISGSEQITNLGFISSSDSITSLNTFTSSIQTEVDGLSAATSSYLTSSGSVDFTDITSLPSGIVSGSTQITDGSTLLSGSIVTQLPSGVVSGSSQITDGSTILSGSITDQLPDGVVSGSSQITNGSGIVSGSTQITDGSTILSGSIVTQLPSGVISGSTQLPSGIVSQSAQTIEHINSTQLVGVNNTSPSNLGYGQLNINDDDTAGVSGLLVFEDDGTYKSYDYVSSNVRYIDSVAGVSIALKPDADASKSWVIDTDGDLVSNGGSWESGSIFANNLIASSSITASNILVDEDIIANNFSGSFIGDGSLLTGIAAGASTDDLSDVTGRGTSTSTVIEITNSTASTNTTTGALTVTGGVGVGGAMNVGGDIVAFSSSDRRLKENILPISNPLQKINSIGGYSFEWNKEKQDIYNGKDYGVIAQEIEEILPELVDTRENGYKAVKYDKLISLLVEGIKELSSEVTELKEKINNRE
jgi:hypothetical protein